MDPFFEKINQVTDVSRKTILVCVVIMIGLIVLIGIQQAVILKKDTLILELAKEKVMYGYPDEDGVFVSKKERPQHIVIDYANEFINNLYVYDKDIVLDNFRRATKMYDANKQSAIAVKLKQDAMRNIQFNYNQHYLPIKNQKISIDESKDKSYYIVKKPIRLKKYTGDNPVDEVRKVIVVELLKVPPTEGNKKGLRVAKTYEEGLR